MNNKEFGTAGEAAGANYLQEQGYKILEMNYRAPVGEIDIIAQNGDILCFVEVKTRKSGGFDRPAMAVSPNKKRHIIKTARWYVYDNGIQDMHIRFDVMEIMNDTAASWEINYIEDAFEV